MSGNAAAAWQAAIKGLQDCCSTTVGLPPDSVEADAAYDGAKLCMSSLASLPTPIPKAALKKVVLQQKIPLQLGTAITEAAAQHSWNSPAMGVAWELLLQLVTMTEGSRSLAGSVQQQLQQSGMLQPLAAVMTAMAADLRTEAANVAAGGWLLAAGDWGIVGTDVEQILAATPHPVLPEVMFAYCKLSMLLASGTLSVPTGGDAHPWVCDPSGHASAAMQLITATARHASSVLQHVLPVLRTHSPQQADEQLRRISTVMQSIQPPAITLASILSDAWSFQQQGLSSRAASNVLQGLLLSADMLPFVTLVLVGVTAAIRRSLAAGNNLVKGSSGGSSGGSSSSTGSTGRRQLQQQHAVDINSSSSAAASVTLDAALTDCQLQLLQCMGFAPEVTAWMEPKISTAYAVFRLHLALNVCSACYDAVKTLVCWDANTGLGTRAITGDVQRWTAEHKLWLLLQSVLVPCAHDLLSCSGQVRVQQQQQQEGPAACAEYLLRVSKSTLHVAALLCKALGIQSAAPAGLGEALLNGMVQVAGRLGEVPGAAAAPPVPTGSSSSSSSSCSRSEVAARVACAGHLLSLLLMAASRSSLEQYQSVPPTAARFVQYSAALETALRIVTAGVQRGTPPDQGHVEVNRLCAALFLKTKSAYWANINCVMLQRMGLCGPAALAQEQRQLYSLLSTVLKLGHCRSAGGQLCWGEQAAGSCCLAAAQAAVSLLSLGGPAGPGQPEIAATAAGAAQQPAVDYLPSLVIFGRCCLQWAEQLQQQAQGLILLAAALLQQERQYQEALLYEHSVANLCVPGLRQEAATLPGEMLESLVGMVFGWVGGLESAACLEQLAAAGCSPQQLQQRLDLLLAAQQGTQQGLTEASLAALVQQLQVTGRMLCGIAVPHFCNNLACGNMSGPTEVRLVSGRSCLCAGCLTARYCGRDCQRAAWKQHKPVCKALAASAAAAAAQGEKSVVV